MQKQASRGFTLIELMITIVIIALLVTVALPGYLEQAAKSRRAEGRTALLKAAQLQERFYSTRVPTVADPIRYAQTSGASNDFPTLFGLGAGAVVYSGENPAINTGHYTVTVDAASAACPIASCYVMRATPNGRHAPDNKCKFLTLDSAGNKGRDPSATESVDYCWGK